MEFVIDRSFAPRIVRRILATEGLPLRLPGKPLEREREREEFPRASRFSATQFVDREKGKSIVFH